MGTITPTIQILPDSELVLWEALGGTDIGAAVSYPDKPNKFIDIRGTWGSATTVIQGSMDGVNYVTLTSDGSIALSFTANSGIKKVYENTKFIRVSTSGGTGSDLDAYLLSR